MVVSMYVFKHDEVYQGRIVLHSPASAAKIPPIEEVVFCEDINAEMEGWGLQLKENAREEARRRGIAHVENLDD